MYKYISGYNYLGDQISVNTLKSNVIIYSLILSWLLRFQIMAAILVLLLFIRYFCSVLLSIYICETHILIYCLIFFENLSKDLVLRNYNLCRAGLFYICGISTFLQHTPQCCVLLEKVVSCFTPSRDCYQATQEKLSLLEDRFFKFSFFILCWSVPVSSQTTKTYFRIDKQLRIHLFTTTW